MSEKIALAIVTKNRTKELARCLNSINKLSLLPNELIVIDNDLNFSAKKVIKKGKYQKKMTINYLPCSGTVPHCRNLALNRSKSEYLAFIDDDCVLDSLWLNVALQAIKIEKADYVLGKTLLLNPENVIALAQYAHDDYWKEYSGQIFDTKNVLINLSSIKKAKLKFDENCQKDHYDSADFDFNFQVKKRQLKAAYATKMELYHQETESFARFSQRAYARGYLAKYLNEKWQLANQLVDFRQKNLMIWLLKTIKNFSKDYQKFSPHMGQENFLKKITATLLIRIFDYYYTLGYVANRKT